MRKLAVVTFLFGWWTAPAPAQTAAPPEIIGVLVGPGATPMPAGVRIYGNDLGWTFEHRGEVQILFGDTWPNARFLCDNVPLNDDSQATLPAALPSGLPALTFLTRPGAPEELAPIVVLRGSESLSMGFGKVPVAGFSDGVDAFGVFSRSDLVRCDRRTPCGRPSSRPREQMTCTHDLGECVPELLGIPAPCDFGTNAGCLPGQTCEPSPRGFCLDPTSSQNDGSAASRRFTIAHNLEIAVQDASDVTTYRSGVVVPSNKFINVTARTVTRLKENPCENDYHPGHGTLLMWGRPFFTAERGRQAQLYLMTHPLPIRRDERGRMRFRPHYFAGVDPVSGKPRWSRRQTRAMPLALDGIVGGSPREEQPIVDQMAMSWLGDPVNKWVMLYGGDLADYLLQDPANARPGPAPGAVRMRFADHPWGPWSAAEPHLLPGSPSVVGDPYGPGGVLFHTLCRDQGEARCAPTDPTRPPDVFFPGCPSVGATFDNGRFYAPNIIDAYTRPDGAGGVDIFWNVSTWNPYSVVLVKTNIKAATSAQTQPCASLPRKFDRALSSSSPTRERFGEGMRNSSTLEG